MILVSSGGLSVAVFAAAQENGGDNSIPGAFGLPTMAGGDRGVYELSADGAAPTPVFAFAVTGPASHLDRHGVYHATFTIRIDLLGNRTLTGGERGKTSCGGTC
jgi:hypothetical protein